MPEHNELADTLRDLEKLMTYAKHKLMIARGHYKLLGLEIQRLEQFLESHGVEVEKDAG